MFTLEAIDYHRNGISGTGFHVILFMCEEGGNMVASVFPEQGCVSVFNRDRLVQKNIAFAQGNSWRGDYYEGWLREQIEQYRIRQDCELAFPCLRGYK